MIIHRIIVGPLYQANCYIVSIDGSRTSIIIDPGDEAKKILDYIRKNNLNPIAILATHSHPDHIGALKKLKEVFSVPLYSALTEFPDNKISGFEIKTIETPGHSRDSVCFVFEKEKIIFTGDVLFKNAIGRTDLPSGSNEEMKKSLKRLMEFPGDFKVYPGHGEETTIGEERKHNSFLLSTGKGVDPVRSLAE